MEEGFVTKVPVADSKEDSELERRLRECNVEMNPYQVFLRSLS
jgi:hypothetical protein